MGLQKFLVVPDRFHAFGRQGARCLGGIGRRIRRGGQRYTGKDDGGGIEAIGSDFIEAQVISVVVHHVRLRGERGQSEDRFQGDYAEFAATQGISPSTTKKTGSEQRPYPTSCIVLPMAFR